jgi:hypothetical protein
VSYVVRQRILSLRREEEVIVTVRAAARTGETADRELRLGI